MKTNFVVREDGQRVAMRFQGKTNNFFVEVVLNVLKVIALAVFVVALCNIPAVQVILAWFK